MEPQDGKTIKSFIYLTVLTAEAYNIINLCSFDALTSNVIEIFNRFQLDLKLDLKHQN